MTIDEAIKIYNDNAEYERTHGNLQGCLEFRQLTEWLKDYKRLKEQEPSVSENPNNCDLISREKVCDYIAEFINHEYSTQSECEMVDSMIDGIQHMPSVKPQTGHWIGTAYDGYADGYPVYYMWECSECGHEHSGESGTLTDFCPDCGARMVEP